MDITGKLDDIFSNYIGRIVAFVLAPVLAIAVPPVVDGLNTALGTDFSNGEISNIAIATIVGLAIVIWQWLRSRGNWEAKLAELHALYESGSAVLDQQPPLLAADGAPVDEDPADRGPGLGENL